MGEFLVKMAKKKNLFMRVDQELLHELKKCKIVKRESYAETVKRLIDKERKVKDPYYMNRKQKTEHNLFLKNVGELR
jgi:hypothetical protein